MRTATQRLIVCAGTGCVANGSLNVYEALKEQIAQAGVNVIVDLSVHDDGDESVLLSRSGCQGSCQMGPLVTLEPDGILYTRVRVQDVADIVQETLLHGRIVERLLYVDPNTKEHCPRTEDITLQTLDVLERPAVAVHKGSLCGLGKTAPNPVLPTLRYFRAEYEAHVIQKRCPAGQCKALVPISIDPALCKGCTACARKCPLGATTGEKKQPHQIDPDVCIKWGACVAA